MAGLRVELQASYILGERLTSKPSKGSCLTAHSFVTVRYQSVSDSVVTVRYQSVSDFVVTVRYQSVSHSVVTVMYQSLSDSVVTVRCQSVSFCCDSKVSVCQFLL